MCIRDSSKIVKELLEQLPSLVDYCIMTEAYAQSIQTWMSDSSSILIANSKQMEMMSQMKNAPSIIALSSVDEDLELGAYAQKGRYLFLEQAQDPGNLGTIIRTAAWFGLDGVLLGKGSTELWNQKVIQASMGAIFKIPHKYVALEELGDVGLPIISTSLQGDDLSNFKWPEGFILCLGNEGKGISNELSALANSNVFIEAKENKGAESLNVAASASILLYSAQIINN